MALNLDAQYLWNAVGLDQESNCGALTEPIGHQVCQFGLFGYEHPHQLVQKLCIAHCYLDVPLLLLSPHQNQSQPPLWINVYFCKS